MLHYFLNCLPILIITIFIKISYDGFWILNMWVLILKLQGTVYKLFTAVELHNETTQKYAHCATNIATAWVMTD